MLGAEDEFQGDKRYQSGSAARCASGQYNCAAWCQMLGLLGAGARNSGVATWSSLGNLHWNEMMASYLNQWHTCETCYCFCETWEPLWNGTHVRHLENVRVAWHAKIRNTCIVARLGAVSRQENPSIMQYIILSIADTTQFCIRKGAECTRSICNIHFKCGWSCVSYCMCLRPKWEGAFSVHRRMPKMSVPNTLSQATLGRVGSKTG